MRCHSLVGLFPLKTSNKPEKKSLWEGKTSRTPAFTNNCFFFYWIHSVYRYAIIGFLLWKSKDLVIRLLLTLKAIDTNLLIMSPQLYIELGTKIK